MADKASSDNKDTSIIIESPSGEDSLELLESINFPADLRKLPVERLPELCRQIRSYLIKNLSTNPGHFGSSMGAVEIIVALHYVFDTPDDRLVFDVGHQAYTHKILTGRREDFKHQRTLGGISGFPNPAESEYDTFVCGHAGNSISAALGMAIADHGSKENRNRKTVALIGDASISGGLAFEGLNNASDNPNNLLIILNDNDMSIDANVGGLHEYLSDITTSRRYNNFRFKLYNFCKKIGLVNEKAKGRMLRFSNALKSLITSHQNIFEGLNIRYFGPINGHDVVKLVKVLNDIKEMQGPRILHIRTQKGKGFAPAENNPAPWHAPGKFDPLTGQRAAEKASKSDAPLWQKVFGEKLVEIASANPNVVGITAAMPSGTSLNLLQEKYPDRMFDVGISEGHAVTFAGGLAAAGKHPFVAIYSAFLQRAVDNIIHDVAIQGLPVTFCIDRAGLVGEDGVTHHGLFDLCYLRMIPDMLVASPSDAPMLSKLMDFAAEHKGPMAIRYPRGKVPPTFDSAPYQISPGKGRVLRTSAGAKGAILSVGPIATEAVKAAEILQDKGCPVDCYDMIWVKPLDETILKEISSRYDYVVTLEDGAREGGFGSAVAEWMTTSPRRLPVYRLGIPDSWVAHGTVSQLRSICGIDAESIAGYICSLPENSQNQN